MTATLDEFWQGMFGARMVADPIPGERRSAANISPADVAEVVAQAQGGDVEAYEAWCEGVFRLTDGRFLYVSDSQCDTCGSGRKTVTVAATLPALARYGIGEWARGVLGLDVDGKLLGEGK